MHPCNCLIRNGSFSRLSCLSLKNRKISVRNAFSSFENIRYSFITRILSHIVCCLIFLARYLLSIY